MTAQTKRDLLYWLVVLVLIAEVARAELPEEPKPHSTCTKWTTLDNGYVMPMETSCGNWPTAPAPQPRKATFWSTRKWTDPPLRTNKAILTSPLFIGIHVAALAASILDVKRSRGAGDYQDALIPLGIVSIGDFVMDKYIWRPFSLGGPAYIIVVHGRGAITRHYQ